MTQPNTDICTVSFQGEAHDSAANALHAIEGYTVEVFPYEGEAFTAEVLGLIIDPGSGQYRVQLAPWDREAGRGDRNRVRALDIYQDIERVEVI